MVGLNPSTADGDADDPTVRRCVGFARTLGFSGLLVGNLFALRSTSPSQLSVANDPVGPENDRWLGELQARSTLVVAAWGNYGRLFGRSQIVLEILNTPKCFGVTAWGEPRHPLYLAASSKLIALPSR